MEWAKLIDTLNGWATGLTIAEVLAYGLLAMVYLMTGCFLAVHWWGKMSEGNASGYDGGGASFCGEEAIVIFVVMVGGFLLCAAFWPIVLLGIWLVRLSRALAGFIK